MCGFEFVSTFLILCEIPLCCALMQSLCVDRNLPAARRWLGRTVGTGAAALGGMAAALGLWFWQEVQYFGTAAEAFASMTQAVTSRVSVSDNAVRAVTIPEVLYLYFVENKEPLLQFGPVTITLLPLLAAVLAEGILCAVLLARRGPAGHGLGAELGRAGIVDGAFQGPRRHTYPSGADAVALCAGAGQLPGTGGHDKRNRIFAVQEET